MGEILFEATKISKAFPGVRALHNVDIHVNVGEVVGIVGENGAGKSTLLNIMSGIYEKDSGKMFLRGKEYSAVNYHSATRQGVSRVFQELALVQNLPVYENLFLSHENKFSRCGIIKPKEMQKKAEEILARINLYIDTSQPVSNFNFSVKQAIEIAKACFISSELFNIPVPLILLDEPTTSLTGEEIEIFFDVVQQLKDHASFIFISHRLSEVLQLSDRIYVFKDGETVQMLSPQDADEERLHELMVGRTRDQDYYKEDEQLSLFGKKVISVHEISLKKCFESISFDVHEGEILGIGGLIGSGKSELSHALAGIINVDHGSIEIDGVNVTNNGIQQLIGKGMGYLPQERHLEGIITQFSVKWNISLSSIRDILSNRLGLLNLSKEKNTAKESVKKMGIKTPDESTSCSNLSGGNQQKVVLAKWLIRDLKILIMDNPTRGVDAGAKEEIYKLLREEAKAGICIVLISDELLELIGMSSRILIMKDGSIKCSIDNSVGNKPTEQQLVKYMV